MSAISILSVYPATLLYAKGDGDEPFACEVVSFLAKRGKEIGMFRKITRLKDNSYQILRAEEKWLSVRLYNDSDCKEATSICISRKWKFGEGDCVIYLK